jgi:hypothetical protein
MQIPVGVCYRLHQPLTALRQEVQDMPIFCKLPLGAIVTTAALVRNSGFVSVMHQGLVYDVFADDLEEFAERM